MKLCYVDPPWAYFTTQELSEQWGDDWNDAPYEHNAGEPYEPCWHRQEKECWCPACKEDYHPDGTPKWEVLKIAFDSGYYLKTPASGHLNSPYSVCEINIRKIPWLYADPDKKILPGATLEEFVEFINSVKGRVYLPAAE